MGWVRRRFDSKLDDDWNTSLNFSRNTSEYFRWFTDKYIKFSNCVLVAGTNVGLRFVAAQWFIVWDYWDVAVKDAYPTRKRTLIRLVQQPSFCLISDSTSAWCWNYEILQRLRYIFTALHGMQTRSYDEISVRPSVCQTRALQWRRFMLEIGGDERRRRECRAP